MKLSRIDYLPLLLIFAAMSAPAQKNAPRPAMGGDAAAYDQAQPARENLDLVMYERIREEGILHSRVMEYASGLMDGIGARLTGSPNMRRANEWTRDQLTAMGCSNAHLEDWGEFGMGWQQLNAWVRMTSPDFQVMIAQAAPWSPATNGPLQGPAMYVDIHQESDMARYKGRLAGKIVLLEKEREVKPVDKPLFVRLDQSDLEKIAEFATRKQPNMMDQIKPFIAALELRAKIGQFLGQEHAAAVIMPSRDGARNGGSGGTVFDDSGSDLGWFAYKREHANPVPVVVMAIENYGRIYRLLQANVPVQLEMNVESRFTGDHEHGFDTIAEIPGTDPNLKDQVVMVGGHLDSWASATGATDNGAGSVVAMEVMRILNALKVKPRRTIRIGLWSGEEEGLFGSIGYVSQHFGSLPLSTSPDQMQLPEFLRKPAGPLQIKPEQKLISAYFNVDNGGGRIRGVYLQQNLAEEPIFRQWIEPLRDLGVTTISVENTGGTDHESFDAVGIPGFQFIQDPLDYGSRTHHSNMDLYEELRPEDLAQAATVEAIFVYNAAVRDQMLPRKPLPHPELEDEMAAPLKGVMPGAVEAKEKSAEEKARPEEQKPPQQ
ncbi:MAG TPA: M28 family peptidase [Terriglobales bacterium]|nr:M28 family peptidase [Terriglobales bacterium]